ncbi:MAG: LysM peptidoglycan-binding domain-containing protein [Luteolibacter sp.]
MSIWTLIKLIAAIVVLAMMGFTGMLAYHILVKPQGGIFEKIAPNASPVRKAEPRTDFAKILDATKAPEIDPGENVYEKASEAIAMGNLQEARERLNHLILTFPGSARAPEARRVIGEMNLDEILSAQGPKHKQVHTVVRGDSFLRIAGRYGTTLEALMYFNGMTDFAGLQPGEELNVVPLNYKLIIEPERKSLSLWDDGSFVCEYPIAHLAGATPPAGKTVIDSKFGLSDNRQVQLPRKEYRGADKVIRLKKPAIMIREFRADDEAGGGIFLNPEDMEELSLLTRPGNEVEIRKTSR